MEQNIQTFQIVYTELDGQMPMVTGISAKTREEAERAFLKANIDKKLVKEPSKEVFVVKAQTL